MNRHVKRLVVVGIFVFSCLLSYRIAYYICEKYFFDKVFYQKSVAFGYWVAGRHLEISDFGKRAYDVIPLYDASLVSKIPASYRVSTSEKGREHVFTVAILGDSYVWGQGVRFEDSMSQVLERKLNAVRKTKVLSIAATGDDMVENYSKYVYLQDRHIDLFIFVLVNNDVVLNIRRKYQNDYDQAIYNSLTRTCSASTGKTMTGIDWSDRPKGAAFYTQIIHDAYDNPANICVLNAVSALYPKQKAIYFDPDNYFQLQDDNMRTYVTALQQNNLVVLSSLLGKESPAYRNYFRNAYKNFHVSAIEDHPSVLAHRMYANILFREITTNPVWAFVHQ